MKLLPSVVASLAVAASVALCVEPARAGESRAKQWIYFRDKGDAGAYAPAAGRPAAAHSAADAGLSERALRRRAKTLPPDRLVQAEDLPIYSPYVAALESLGVEVVVRSKWMNAVSAVVPAEAFGEVTSLPFVERLEPVRAVSGGTGAPDMNVDRARPGARREIAARPEIVPATEMTTLPGQNTLTTDSAPFSPPDYGPSFAQLDAVRVPQLHALGITGRDVVVGLLDSGYRWRAHRSLSGMRVLKEYDFVSGDGDTADGPGDPAGEDRHGTLVLSVIGAYAPGSLVGPAYQSSYLLAKTEYEPTETQAEEDYWAAGIEWLEANGADVVNSSVGYDTWDGGSGYSWGNGDFDGRTSVVAKAAQRAARLGVILCVCMGNEGNGDGVTGTMLTPADADTAVSVGAATFDGQLSTSSSTGPTSDGRTKPDLIAPGSGVYCASTSGTDAYYYQSGTSLASPLAAGAAALLLSARPELTPVEVRDILRASADTARVRNYDAFPNNFTGWGYLDALSAVLSTGVVFSNRPSVRQGPDGAVVSIDVVSRAGIDQSAVVLWYRDENDATALPETLAMSLDSAFAEFPGSGRFSATIPPHAVGTEIALGIAATDSAGESYSSPAPALYDRWVLSYGSGDVEAPADIPVSMRLLQNYPNPFNSGTNIVFDLPAAGRVIVNIYNVIGQLVAEPFNGDLEAGAAGSRAPVVFNGAGLPSGLYLCRLSSPSGTVINKMLLLK
jgi:serine protease AprX